MINWDLVGYLYMAIVVDLHDGIYGAVQLLALIVILAGFTTLYQIEKGR